MALNIPSRVIHDLGLAAWFGGTLANAVALNRAAAETSNFSSAGRVVNAGWNAWTPVNGVAIGAHLLGSLGQLRGNKDRLFAQKGVGSMAITKTALTVAALGVTGYSRLLGQRIADRPGVPVEAGTEPTVATSPEVASAQKQLKILQWVIPALTGALIVVSAYAGEQQRPGAIKAGVLDRLNPLS